MGLKGGKSFSLNQREFPQHMTEQACVIVLFVIGRPYP
jgi:hypothetical protein